MPSVDGLELCKHLRADPEFDSVASPQQTNKAKILGFGNDENNDIHP